MATPVFHVEPNWNASEQGTFVGSSMMQDWELSDRDRLCFQCPLDDCHENSNKCLMRQASRIGVAAVIQQLKAVA